MNKKLLVLALASSLGMSPLIATAAMQMSEAEAAVQSMLAEDKSASEILNVLVEDGRSLPEATATAVEAASSETGKLELAKAGICASADLAEAEKVSEAALKLVGEGATANEIKTALETYAAEGCEPGPGDLPPPANEDQQRPGGGTVPSLVPPVSPS